MILKKGVLILLVILPLAAILRAQTPASTGGTIQEAIGTKVPAGTSPRE